MACRSFLTGTTARTLFLGINIYEKKFTSGLGFVIIKGLLACIIYTSDIPPLPRPLSTREGREERKAV